MIHDVAEALEAALADLRVLADAITEVEAERAVAGVDHTATRRGSDHPLPYRADADGRPDPHPLDRPWAEAMRRLAAAFAQASDCSPVTAMLGGCGDVAQASVRPDPTRQTDNWWRLRLAHDVTHRMLDAWRHDGMAGHDASLALAWCEKVSDAVDALPRWLRDPGSGPAMCHGRAAVTRDQFGEPVLTDEPCPDHRRVVRGRRACRACEERTRGVLAKAWTTMATG